MISLPLFRVLVFKVFEILAVEHGVHVICRQHVQPAHDVLLVDGIVLERFPVDLQNVGYVVVIRHLSAEVIRCFQGRLLDSGELKVNFILFLEIFEHMLLDSFFLQLVDVHENCFHHFHIVGISLLRELNFEDDIVIGISINKTNSRTDFRCKALLYQIRLERVWTLGAKKTSNVF